MNIIDTNWAVDLIKPAAPDIKFPAIGAWIELPELRHNITVGVDSYAQLGGHLCAEQAWGGTASGGFAYKVDAGAWVPMAFTFGGWSAVHMAAIVCATPTPIWLTAGAHVVRVGGYSDHDNCYMQYGTRSLGGVPLTSVSHLLYVPVGAVAMARDYSGLSKGADQGVAGGAWTVITGLTQSITVVTDRYVDVTYGIKFVRSGGGTEYVAGAYRVDGGAWQYLGSIPGGPWNPSFSGSEQVWLTSLGSPHSIEFGIYGQWNTVVCGGGTLIDGKPIVSTSAVVY